MEYILHGIVTLQVVMDAWQLVCSQCELITLALGGEYEGRAFGSVCLYVCRSVRAGNLKTIAPIDLIFTQEGV